MLDFTDGWTWFVSGLLTTVAVVVILLVAVSTASLAERRARPHGPT